MTRRTAVLLLAAALVALAALAGRLAFVARRELDAGLAAEAAGSGRAAQVCYERAGRCYFPGNRYASDALRRLASLGRDWERAGRVAHALSAGESVRGILLDTGGARMLPGLMAEASGRVERLRPALEGLWPEGAAGHRARADAAGVAPPPKRDPRALPGIAGLLLFWGACLAAGLAPRSWAAPDSGGKGWRLCAAASLLLAAALALLRYA